MKTYTFEFKAFEVLESQFDQPGYSHVGYFEKYEDALSCVNMKPNRPRHIKHINENINRYVCESLDDHKERLAESEREALGV